MNRENFNFEGLAEIEARILRLSDDADYLIIQDRTVPKSDETIARFDLNDTCALPYLDDAPDPEVPRDDGVDTEGFFGGSDAGDIEGASPSDTSDDGADPEAAPPDPPPRVPTEPLPRTLLCRAACRWIRDVARRNSVGEEWRRFHVRLYGPKGHRLLDSGQFVCRNHDFDLHLPIGGEAAPLPAPVPDFEAAASVGGSKAIKALGEYYARLGQIVLGTVGQLQGVNNATISRLHRDPERGRDEVEELVASRLIHHPTRSEQPQLDRHIGGNPPGLAQFPRSTSRKMPHNASGRRGSHDTHEIEAVFCSCNNTAVSTCKTFTVGSFGQAIRHIGSAKLSQLGAQI